MSRLSTVLFTASLASLALAKTDLTGCTSTDVSSPAGASIAWYVPGTGELCEFLDCGGGQAPPKTTVPGCPLYSGTATYSPSYLSGYGAMSTSSAEAAMSTSYGSASDSSSSAAVVPVETTMATASSDTTESNTSLDNSAVGVTSYETASASASSVSSGMSTITSSPAPGVVGGGSNGTSTGSGSSSGTGSNTNGTVSSASPSPITSNSGAMETARVWLGGSALLGLGAIVAAL